MKVLNSKFIKIILLFYEIQEKCYTIEQYIEYYYWSLRVRLIFIILNSTCGIGMLAEDNTDSPSVCIKAVYNHWCCIQFLCPRHSARETNLCYQIRAYKLLETDVWYYMISVWDMWSTEPVDRRSVFGKTFLKRHMPVYVSVRMHRTQASGSGFSGWKMLTRTMQHKTSMSH
jgi:hypothetical protein